MTPQSRAALAGALAHTTAPNALQLDTLMQELGVSYRDLAQACRISKSACYSWVHVGVWPKRRDVAALQLQVREYLAAQGATPQQMDHMFEPASAIAPAAPNRPLQDGGHVKLRRQVPAANPNPETEVLLPKQTLSPAARKAFRLFTNPFDGEVLNDAQLFVNAEIAYVREACWQAAMGGRFVALVSESGGGKSTILADLEERILRDHRQVLVVRPSVLGMEDTERAGYMVKAGDILAAIIATLDPLTTVPQTLEARSKKVARLLRTSIEAGFSHLLVIEEAHCLPDSTLKHLKRLHELHLGRKPMLGILLVGQPELQAKLDPRRAHLREVTQRCEVIQLLPLDADLKDYLAHRAQLAGLQLAQLMDDTAIEEIRTRLTVVRGGTGGKARATSLLYPLAVNNLVTAALNTAAELGVPVVTRDVVAGV